MPLGPQRALAHDEIRTTRTIGGLKRRHAFHGQKLTEARHAIGVRGTEGSDPEGNPARPESEVRRFGPGSSLTQGGRITVGHDPKGTAERRQLIGFPCGAGRNQRLAGLGPGRQGGGFGRDQHFEPGQFKHRQDLGGRPRHAEKTVDPFELLVERQQHAQASGAHIGHARHLEVHAMLAVAHGASEGVLHMARPVGVKAALKTEDEQVAGFFAGDFHVNRAGGYLATTSRSSAGGSVRPSAAALATLADFITLGETAKGMWPGSSPRMTRSISATAASPPS